MAEFIILNDADPENESALGATNIFSSFEEAMFECEHWVSEEPGMRFYDARGERLIAVDHGNWRTFHFERSGTFFEGFEDLIKREAERAGVVVPEGAFSAEYVLRTIWETGQKLRQERQLRRARLLPTRAFRQKNGFWSWYLPFLRKEPSE